MQIIFQLMAASSPPTPDSEGHDLTWPYWVGCLVAALLVIVIPMTWGRKRAGGERTKQAKAPVS
jgi:hypothetical protein